MSLPKYSPEFKRLLTKTNALLLIIAGSSHDQISLIHLRWINLSNYNMPIATVVFEATIEDQTSWKEGNNSLDTWKLADHFSLSKSFGATCNSTDQY